MRQVNDQGPAPVMATDDHTKGGAQTKRGPLAETWPGRRGNLGYLAKMFPRVSETFILREILALRSQGIPLRIYSLLPPTRDARIHRKAKVLLPEVVILPQPGIAKLGGFLGDLLDCLKSRPGAALLQVLRTLMRPGRRSWRRLFRAVSLAARLRRDHVAHLHAAWAHTPASVARIASRLVGVPWSMGAHAKDIHLSRRESLAKKISAARFTTVCSRSYRDLLAEIGTQRETDLVSPSILLNYHGVDTKYFVPKDDQTSGLEPASLIPVILSVGRLVEKKGFDTLLEAVARLRDRGICFRLEIVGEGPLRASIEAQVRSLDLQQTVTLRGMLTLEEVRTAYSRAACVVLASRIAANGDRDGIPNTLAEAMSSGAPVVSTSLPSIEEIVSNGNTGLLVPPNDPGALADAIQRVLHDSSLSRKLVTAARNWICTNFDSAKWEKRVAERLAKTLGIERILYLSADRGVPVRGSKGASVHVRAVVNAMERMGAEARVLTSRPGPQDGPALHAPLIEAGSGKTVKKVAKRVARRTRGGPPLERALLRVTDNLPIYCEARRQARAFHPDIIYERYALTALAGSLLARRLGVPHILEVNAPLADEEARFRGLRLAVLAHRLERWLLRRADRVLVVSEALAEHARRLGVASRRIVVLPNAVEPHVFHPDRDGSSVRARFALDGAFVIGFTGTMKPWHGLHHLLRAVNLAFPEMSNAHLLVVGDGPVRSDLEELAKNLALASRVHFTGFVPHVEVGDYLAACDVLAAPYGPLENHWFSPLKVAEYLATGRPVIASAIGQLQERFAEEQGVVLVPPGDEDALSRVLVEIARDPDRRARLARSALAASRWTWTDLVCRVFEESEGARRELWGWQT